MIFKTLLKWLTQYITLHMQHLFHSKLIEFNFQLDLTSSRKYERSSTRLKRGNNCTESIKQTDEASFDNNHMLESFIHLQWSMAIILIFICLQLKSLQEDERKFASWCEDFKETAHLAFFTMSDSSISTIKLDICL